MPAIDYTTVKHCTPVPSGAGRITEILLHNRSVSLHPVLLPMITELSRDNRWLTLINPPTSLNRDLLSRAGATTGHILSLCSHDGRHAPLELCRQALAAGTSHTVIAWYESGSAAPLHQLDLAASIGHAQAILVRH